jgi:hypothetical protein
VVVKTYDLYGVAVDGLESAKDLVNRALGIQLVAHESGYHCGEYYRLGGDGDEHFILQRNFDEFEGEWTEVEHQRFGILLYVNETNRSATLEGRLSSGDEFSLLRHQEL